MALALVRDLREHRVPASAEELARFETDARARFVLAVPGSLGPTTYSRSTSQRTSVRAYRTAPQLAWKAPRHC